MIKQTKLEEFSNCNGCSRYNMQPNFDSRISVLECGEVYQYILYTGKTGIEIRLCNKCANELKELLEKQLGENK